MAPFSWLRAKLKKSSDHTKALIHTGGLHRDGHDYDASMNLELLRGFGGWRLRGRLGQGAYGVVHKIANKRGQLLAWKTCKIRGDWDKFNGLQRWSHQASLRRFKREYYTICQLYHPHIVSPVEIGMFVEDPHRHSMSYAMEYLPDGDLHAMKNYYHTRGEDFPELIAFQVFRQMLEALAYLEPLRRCHNDLKPDNILVMKLSANKYVFKLTDFAFSSIMDDRNTYEGVPRYVAPEVLYQRKHSPKSDVFSLWCVILHLMNVDGHCDMAFQVSTGDYNRAVRHAEDIWMQCPPLWYWRGCGALDVSHRHSASTVLWMMDKIDTSLDRFMNEEILQMWETDGVPMLLYRLEGQVAADVAQDNLVFES